MKRSFIYKILLLIIALTTFLFLASALLLQKLYNKEFLEDKTAPNIDIVEENIEEHIVILPNDETINIAVIGDIMCHKSQYNDAYDPNTGEYDFSYVFEDIKGYIESADFSIGNLETTLAGKEIGYSSYPEFNTPEKMATDLKELGIDLLSTTNNHSLDKGFTGIVNTIDELDKVGLLHTGTYKTEEDASKLMITEVNEVKIGVVAYTYGTNGIKVPYDYCINLIDDEKIISDLDKMKNENVDLTIAIMHWGEEYEIYPNSEQERLANLLFENGVDIILGSHPHVLQKMEKKEIIYEDSQPKDVFVIYSLGNFISGQAKENTKQSVILNLEITKHYGENKKITIDSVNYTPLYMYDKNGSKRYKLLDIEKEIKDFESGETRIDRSVYDTLRLELDHIYSIVGGEY